MINTRLLATTIIPKTNNDNKSTCSSSGNGNRDTNRNDHSYTVPEQPTRQPRSGAIFGQGLGFTRGLAFRGLEV